MRYKQFCQVLPPGPTIIDNYRLTSAIIYRSLIERIGAHPACTSLPCPAPITNHKSLVLIPCDPSCYPQASLPITLLLILYT
jgi:hypothetical protein